MNRVIAFIIFLSVFLSIYFGLNYYVAHRLAGFFSIQKGAIFYTVFLALTLSYIVSNIFERLFSNWFTRSFYYVSGVWMGVLFFLFSLLILYELLRHVIKVQPITYGYVIVGVVFLISVYATINGAMLKTKTYEIQTDKINENVNIVHLSDIHVGSIHKLPYLRRIVDKVKPLNPDLVLITGDLIDGTGHLNSDMFSPFDELDVPVYFSTGNHETYANMSKVTELIEKTNIKFLRDEKALHNGIEIIGVSWPDFERRLNVTPVLDKIGVNKSKYSVLMFHAPDTFDDAVTSGIDLQLSGHTHNGQIIPFNLLVRTAYKNINGLYEKDGSHIHTSPGTGTWGPPMRFGSNNQITLIKLVPETLK